MKQRCELRCAVHELLERIPPRHREDAEQVAHLAILEGRSAEAAVISYTRQVLMTESRELTEDTLRLLPKEEKQLDMKYATKAWLATVHGTSSRSERARNKHRAQRRRIRRLLRTGTRVPVSSRPVCRHERSA